jgi:endogenous inhibitor of DNA gyrase (YacG/DUF329 family)
MAKITRNCPICQKEFVVRSSARNQKYCSQPCQHKSLIGNTPPNKKPIEYRVCMFCNKPFSTWHKKPTQKFCSFKCSVIGTHGDVKTRLLSKITIDPKTNCWVYNGAKQHPAGYRTINIDGKIIQAHRASYEAHVRKLQPSEIILHLCDNPPCINPTHLRAGSHFDNVQDMVSKGRGAKGEQRSKLYTTEDIIKIRQLHKTGEYNYKQLSELFGGSRTQIYSIVLRRSWKHVPP